MPGRDRNLSRKAPMADDLLLRWEGNQEYQPQIQHPVAKTPRPNADPNYEAQVAPPVQQIGLNAPPPLQPQNQETDDFRDEERQAFESILSQISEDDWDRFIERMNKYRRLRQAQALARQAQGQTQI